MTRPPPHIPFTGPSERMVNELASLNLQAKPTETRIEISRTGREISIYPGRIGYDLQDELDFLSNRALEPNVFFSGRFLAPAMPRLDEREVNFLLMRDRDELRNRLRLLMPFAVERPGFAVGPSIIRVWANHFAPLGTPLVDAERAAETLDDLLEGLARPDLNLAQVLVLPDLRINGVFARMLKAVAIARNLPVTIIEKSLRPMLESDKDAQVYLREAVSSSHLREMRRQRRLLDEKGVVTYNVARQPREIQVRFEEFLALEAGGWKGKRRSALVTDRYHTAFAREAISNLAAVDAVRIHTMDLDGKAIASIVVLMMGGEAYTWKTAYAETYARYSPGKLLMAELTEWHLDDPNILRSDSCAVADHPIMSRFWLEREEMGTMVVGLNQNSDRDMRQVAAQMHMYRSTRNMAKMLRDRILSLARRNG